MEEEDSDINDLAESEEEEELSVWSENAEEQENKNEI
jgi:hypothetical protein